MRPIIVIVIVIVCVLATAGATAQECVCRLDGTNVSISNFPSVQKVDVTNGTLSVKETDNSRNLQYTSEFGTGERRAFGPIALDGRRRIQIQLSQIHPKMGSPSPVTVRWYVRYHTDDPFFDPCPQESNAPSCSTGFPAAGARLRPLKPSSLADQLDGFYLTDATPVSIAVLDVVGAEGLLVIENQGTAPRQLRANLVLDR